MWSPARACPVAFYAEMRGHKQDQAVKCELSRDRVRLIYLSSYDKKGNPAPPSKPAGEDGLGDMVMEPAAPRQQGFDSLDLNLGDIKKVETDKGLLKLKLTQQEIYSVPDLFALLYTRRGPAGAQVCQQLHPAVRALSRPGGFQAGNRRHERRREIQDGIQHRQRQRGYGHVGFRRDRRNRKRAGRDHHYPDNPFRDGFAQRELCHLGKKRGRPATTSGWQVDSKRFRCSR